MTARDRLPWFSSPLSLLSIDFDAAALLRITPPPSATLSPTFPSEAPSLLPLSGAWRVSFAGSNCRNAPTMGDETRNCHGELRTTSTPFFSLPFFYLATSLLFSRRLRTRYRLNLPPFACLKLVRAGRRVVRFSGFCLYVRALVFLRCVLVQISSAGREHSPQGRLCAGARPAPSSGSGHSLVKAKAAAERETNRTTGWICRHASLRGRKWIESPARKIDEKKVVFCPIPTTPD